MPQVYANNRSDFLREIYIETNSNRIITSISKNCYNILGYNKQDLLNKNIDDYICSIPENIVSNMNFEATITSKNGTLIDIDVIIAPIPDNNGNLNGLKLSLINISKYKKINIDEKRLFEMFKRSKDIIYRCDLVPKFKFTFISPSIQELLGYTAEEHLANPSIVFEIAHPDDYEVLIKKVNGYLDYSSPIPTRFKHKNGGYVWLDDFCTPIYDSKGNLVALEGFSRDITEKRELEEKLEKLSFYDGLTGLHNKLYLENQIDILNTEEDTAIGVIFCDLDNLKIINDTLGHEFGDKLIIYTSNILMDTFKENSIIARTGGDEFIIIIKNTKLDEVKNLYSLLFKSIEQQNKYNKDLSINVSIGYSFSETSIGITRQVINIADKNMYKDKQRKKL